MSDGAEAPRSFGQERQFEIYLAGLQGQRPALPLDPDELEQQARQCLSPEAFNYVARGAGAEETLRANRAAFARWRIVPRVLRNVERRDLRCRLLNTALPAPLLLAPIGVQSIVHDEAEAAAARAAASLGVPFVLSTASSRSIEEVAAVMGDAPRWFQLYWGKNPELTASLLSRAERAGYGAVVVTLDTPLLGWRESDLQAAYLPFLLGEGLANYLSDPVFRAALPVAPEENLQAAIGYFVSIFGNPALTWDDLSTLRAQTTLPILLKGILHPDDAARAVAHGADGLIVSNHGGRQVDGAIAALDALPGIVEAAGDAAAILFDGGIRRGADALKALALGAQAVLLGRPYIWGLALGGESGVREVLRNLLADLDLALALSGYASPTELTPAALVKT